MTHSKLMLVACALATSATVEHAITAQAAPFDLQQTLARAGDRVEAFFTRAQSLVCTETVVMQPLSSSLSADGPSRSVESELRLSWQASEDGEAATEAQTRRQVLKVNGRAPRKDDHRSCTTPERNDTETQPLSMLLAGQRTKYDFSAAGMTRLDGRAALMVDFREVASVSVDVQPVDGLDDCISYDLEGGQRGRLWIDADSHDVLRLDSRLTSMVELRMPRLLIARRPGASMYLTLERQDATLRFGRVDFSNPDESIVLPLTSSELRIVRGASRLRTMTRYTDYRRFLTSGRVVG